MAAKKKPKNWIRNALGKPGQLHEDLHVPLGQKIPRSLLEEAAKRQDIVGKRARLALTLQSFHGKGKGKAAVTAEVKRRRKRSTIA